MDSVQQAGLRPLRLESSPSHNAEFTDDLLRKLRQWKADLDEACAAVVTALDGELNADALEALRDLAEALDR